MTTAPDDRRLAVLFVDDEEMARKYFRLAFARDFDVLLAGGVPEAIEVLEREGERIAILITDQRMPGLQGVDLLKRVRSDWPQIVRMLTTAYSDLEDAIAAVNRGEILRYITKPWDLESLRAELRHGMEFYLLRRERDLLVEEKLSVRERVSQADRLRSLLAIAAGLANLRHVPQAVSAWALCAAGAQRPEQVAAEDLELWGLEVRQTQDLMAVHRRLRELDALAEGGFPDPVSPRALLAAHGFEPQGNGPVIQASRILLERLLAALRPGVTDRVLIEEATPGGMRVPGLAAVLVFEGGNAASASVQGLLDAHLIAWHHGGSIRMESDDGTARVRVTLPADPSIATVHEPDDTWIADQFSRLEP